MSDGFRFSSISRRRFLARSAAAGAVAAREGAPQAGGDEAPPRPPKEAVVF